MASRVAHKMMRPFRVLRDEGPREFAARVLAKAHARVARHRPAMLVDLGDASRVDWTVRPPAMEDPYRSPFPAGSGSGAITLRPPGDSGQGPGSSVQTMPLSYGAAPSAMQTHDGVARIYYGHGATNLSPAGKQVVSEVAQRQTQYNPGGLIAVEAHASNRAEASDPVERRIVNLKTSMDRAYKVSSALMRAGVPATAIRTTAYGDTRPAAALPGVSAEDASRRVEIFTGQ